MKVTIHVFIVAEQASRWNLEKQQYEKEIVYKAWPCDISKNAESDSVLATEIDIEVEVPDGFDIRSGLVENLEREKQRIGAEYQKRVTELNAQIQSLLAIEA